MPDIEVYTNAQDDTVELTGITKVVKDSEGNYTFWEGDKISAVFVNHMVQGWTVDTSDEDAGGKIVVELNKEN